MVAENFIIKQDVNQFNLTTASHYPEIESSGLSHIGHVREENQDTIRLPEGQDGSGLDGKGLLFALADGMGGYALGTLASQMALDILYKTHDEAPKTPSLKTLKTGIETANLNIYKEAQRRGVGRMGTTLTAAMFSGSSLFLGHVGDSRAYLVRGGRASSITNDHSMVGDLVRMKVLPPEKVSTHAQRSILTKAVGLGLFIQPDLTRLDLQTGDRLIICCDGVWSVIRDEEFSQLAAEHQDVSKLSQVLIDLALDRKTDDNVSVIAIRVNALPRPNGNGHGSARWYHFFRRKSHE